MEKPIGISTFECAKKIKNAMNHQGVKVGIPAGFHRVLIELGLRGDAKTYQNDLVNCVKHKKSTISVTLANMEDDGLIARFKDEEDQRKTLVKLTPKGKEAFNQLHNIMLSIEKDIEDVIGLENVSKLQELFGIINSKMDERSED